MNEWIDMEGNTWNVNHEHFGKVEVVYTGDGMGRNIVL